MLKPVRHPLCSQAFQATSFVPIGRFRCRGGKQLSAPSDNPVVVARQSCIFQFGMTFASFTNRNTAYSEYSVVQGNACHA